MRVEGVAGTPWRRHDWLRTVSSWNEARIEELGYRLTAPIERFRSSSISCILRARTDRGDFYFKQSLRLPVFSDEISVLEGLLALYPGHVPKLIAADHRHGWMLSEDFGHPVGGEAPPAVWDEVFSTFGRIQAHAAAHIDRLTAMGCREVHLTHLTDRIETLAWETAKLSALDDFEVRRLHELTPRLSAMSSELQECRVPRSLVHGDLHLGNVAFHGGRYLFFDWVDSCVSHPFLDIAYIFAENAKHEAQCRDAYLVHWTEYESMDRLRKMWALAEPLSALHQAITYQETACCLEEPSRTHFIRGVTYFVRQLLKSAAL